MKPGTLVYLPDAPSARTGAKPKQRTGVVVASAWNLPGYVLVEKCDRPGQWWVPERILSVEPFQPS